jgi:hypothetical protein
MYCPNQKLSVSLVLLLILLISACSKPPPSQNLATPGASPSALAEPMLPGLPAEPQGLPLYTLTLDLDYAAHTYQGHARVDYTNQEDGWLDRLYFRLYPNGGLVFGPGSLSVSYVKVNGQLVDYTLVLQDTVLELPLPVRLEVGQAVTVDLDFNGNVPQDFGQVGYGGGYGIFNYSQGVLALAGWYPILAVYDAAGWNLDPVYSIGDPIYSDAALYSVELTADPSLVVAATGLQVSREMVGEHVRTRFESGPARDFFLIASPDFSITSQVVDGTQINAYTLPGGEVGVDQALQVAAFALQTFNQRFGPYPYTEFDLVAAPMNIAIGVEYPGIVLIASSLYAHPDSSTFTSVIAHEVAHQWWYNVVGNNVIDDPWLDEALTTYSSILFWEAYQGDEAESQALDYYQSAYEGIAQSGQDGPVAGSLVAFVEAGRSLTYSPVVYAKGCMFFDALRQTVGDEVFITVLSGYYTEHWFGIAKPADLLDAFEQTADLSLDSFYDVWLYNPPLQGPGEIPTPTPTPEQPAIQTATATPEPPTPQEITFAVIGDYGSNDQGEAEVADLVLSWETDLVITLGDNNYPAGADYTIDEAIGRYYQSFIYPYTGTEGSGATLNRFFPSLGNHDLYTHSGQPYFDYFSLPGNERYYDFTWGSVHFFCLNSNDSEPDGVGASSAQADWLQAGLAASTSAWNVVYFHHAPYSSGRHGSIDWMQWPFAAWGADVVLAAHDHTYERLQVDGIPYFVNGLGGGGIYDFRTILSESLVRYNAGHGAMRVAATDQSMTFQFITDYGVVVDDYEIQR